MPLPKPPAHKGSKPTPARRKESTAPRKKVIKTIAVGDAVPPKKISGSSAGGKKLLSAARPAADPAKREQPYIKPGQHPPAGPAAAQAAIRERAYVKPSQALIVSPTAAQAAKQHPVPRPLSLKGEKRTPGIRKLFVLDTNVLMHDPMCLFKFSEHDIFIPMVTLEELDNNKKGAHDASRNARQSSREIAALVEAHVNGLEDGIVLSSTGRPEAEGRLYLQTQGLKVDPISELPDSKNDNEILAVALALSKSQARPVVMVSKDINVRIKARLLGVHTEDYRNDKALNDGDLLHSGVIELSPDFWEVHGTNVSSWRTPRGSAYRISGPICESLTPNAFVYMDKEGQESFEARVLECGPDYAILETARDYTNPRNSVWGVVAKNREQSFAMNLLMDPECDFVTLAGNAGTGKTLMALAAALTQAIEGNRYTEVIVTRATVSVGEDIGFLPGSEEEKMSPWMGAIDDNLEFLSHNIASQNDWDRAAKGTAELLKSKIRIKSMNFMRGRTFLNKFVIIDEAQNLTPKQMKTLVTRAGPGTKIVCMGNLQQIDTPYLTEGSSGLTFAVDRFKTWDHSGHVTLARGERSRLADFAALVL